MTKTVDAVDEDQGVDEGSLGCPHVPVHNTVFYRILQQKLNKVDTTNRWEVFKYYTFWKYVKY